MVVVVGVVIEVAVSGRGYVVKVDERAQPLIHHCSTR